MTRGAGVSAEGMRLARAASIWRRSRWAEGIAAHLRLIFAYREGLEQGGFAQRAK
jgi:hypothetical protein